MNACGRAFPIMPLLTVDPQAVAKVQPKTLKGYRRAAPGLCD